MPSLCVPEAPRIAIGSPQHRRLVLRRIPENEETLDSYIDRLANIHNVTLPCIPTRTRLGMSARDIGDAGSGGRSSRSRRRG